MNGHRCGFAAVRLACIIALLLACASCPGPPPGKGAKALAGYRRAELVIVALERYRQRHGIYPDSLALLVPEYLGDTALAIPEHAALRFPLQYELTADGYRLGFRYTGPGMNQCWYRSVEGRWHCTGYY